jgi:DNA polymerase III delta prime subunit
MSMGDYLWVEQYRPPSIKECILPVRLKSVFQAFVDKNQVPNLLLSGGPGVGKTTVARALLNELDLDYIIINGSMKGNIDTLRTEISQFASTVSFTGGRKYVILDEADYLNPQSTQPALRNFMEEFSNNCGFILTCNFKNRIIEPLHSRCSVVDFTMTNKEKAGLASQFMKRVENILKMKGVEFDQKVIAELIMKHMPDWRRVLNELQRYSVTGKIDVGILTTLSDESFDSLVSMMKNQDFTGIRKWVVDNADIESSTLFRKLYDYANKKMKPMSVAQMVLILAKYQYQAAFVVDHEINNVACLLEIMTDCEWS